MVVRDNAGIITKMNEVKSLIFIYLWCYYVQKLQVDMLAIFGVRKCDYHAMYGYVASF